MPVVEISPGPSLCSARGEGGGGLTEAGVGGAVGKEGRREGMKEGKGGMGKKGREGERGQAHLRGTPATAIDGLLATNLDNATPHGVVPRLNSQRARQRDSQSQKEQRQTSSIVADALLLLVPRRIGQAHADCTGIGWFIFWIARTIPSSRGCQGGAA